ncbi:MAG: F0F1 ATP synthase subunit beta [Candidatus Orphnella occulta]|nr:F0F1 ATP synthase subunit beta [Candidatus Orphnella occulta]
MEKKKMQKGKVISVQGPIVIVRFDPNPVKVAIYDILEAKAYNGQRIVLEAVEYVNEAGDDTSSVVKCIPLTSTVGLQKNAEVVNTGAMIHVPVGEEVCSRILNVLGEPIDKKGPVNAKLKKPIRRPESASSDAGSAEELRFEVMESGIKVIDLLFPLVKGTKTGILGGAALGKSVLMLELMHNIITKQKGFCIFTGAGERVREGNELYYEMLKQKILDRSILVYGQMNESPGARFEVVHTGVTLAEHFQEENEDVLFFIDSVYRFAQAGSELSTLLGRIPSETGYQPTLTSEMSDFQERIRSGSNAAITAIEAVYVPSDDLTDPAIVCIFSYLESILILSREYVQLGFHPAIDPLLSSCSYMDPVIIGKRHFKVAQDVLKILNKYQELRRIVSIIGVEELSKEDRILFERARRLQNFLTQPFFTAEVYTGKKGEYVPLEKTLASCEKIVSGELDKTLAENLYMIGSL